MKLERILGNFPVFAKKLTDESKNSWDTELTEEGFTNQPSPQELNLILNKLSTGLSYLYQQGIPEYSYNVAYAKGAIVSFEGELYTSFVENNTKHISQSSHWGKFVLESNDSKNKMLSNSTDNNPIGTILTVPSNTNLVGYMDYVGGASFDPLIYPELFKALGTNRFSEDTSNTVDAFPVGTLIHWLSVESDIPKGWLEWSPYESIQDYPELINVLRRMATNLDTTASIAWNNALNRGTFPAFDADTFYLGCSVLSVDEIGKWSTDRVKSNEMLVPPVVIDNSNTLNPMGVYRCNVEENVLPLVSVTGEEGVTRKLLESSYVVVAQKADAYANVDKRLNSIQLGSGDVTAPKTVLTRLLVKASSQEPQHISSTHKRVIKYA